MATIGNYAYDWHDGTGDPDNIEEAWEAAADSDARPVFDRVAGNSVSDEVITARGRIEVMPCSRTYLAIGSILDG